MTESQRISLYLKENNISTDTLSEMTGISAKRLKSILNNGKTMKLIEHIKIITALGVEPNAFLSVRKPGEKPFNESSPIIDKLMVNISALSEKNLGLLLHLSNGLLKNDYQKEKNMEVAL